MAEIANKIGKSAIKKVISAIKFRESANKGQYSRRKSVEESKIEEISVK